MRSIQHSETSRTPCCSPGAAWCHVREVAWMALRDEVAPHALAAAVDHALKMIRAGVPR